MKIKIRKQDTENSKQAGFKKYFIFTVFLLLASVLCLAGYVPTPAPNPMGDFVAYKNQLFEGYFVIEDPNGPEGLTITCQPAGLNIEEPNIYLADANYPDSRAYVYDFSYLPTSAGQYDFLITATDIDGIEVSNTIHFQIKGNDPHVFTESQKGKAPSGEYPPISNNIMWDDADAQWPIVLYGKTYLHQMKSNDNGIGVQAQFVRIK